MIAECQDALEDIERHKGKKETAEKYQKKYGVECFSDRISMLEREEREAMSRIELLQRDVSLVENAPPVVVKRDAWNIQAYHPQHRVVFDIGTPFHPEVTIIDGEESANNSTELCFDVTYSNGSFIRSVAHVGLSILRVACLLFPDPLLVLEPPAKALDDSLLVKCAGSAVFSVHPKDIPENYRSLEEMKQHIRALEEKATKAKRDREEHVHAMDRKLEDRIRTVLGGSAEQKKILESFEQFRHFVTGLAASQSTEIQLHYDVALAICGGSNRTIDAQDFLRLFSDLHTGSVKAVANASEVCFADLDAENLSSLLTKEFP